MKCPVCQIDSLISPPDDYEGQMTDYCVNCKEWFYIPMDKEEIKKDNEEFIKVWNDRQT